MLKLGWMGEHEIASESLLNNVRFSSAGTSQAGIPEVPAHPHFISFLN